MISVSRCLLRALQLRCIACGARPVLLSWFRESPNCPRCGFRLDRAESGYWLGSYNVNLCATLLLLTVGMVAVIWLEWPDPNWTAITVGACAAAVALPLLIFPVDQDVLPCDRRHLSSADRGGLRGAGRASAQQECTVALRDFGGTGRRAEVTAVREHDELGAGIRAASRRPPDTGKSGSRSAPEHQRSGGIPGAIESSRYRVADSVN